MKWKRLSSSKIFEHPRLTIYEDTVKLPSGLETTYVKFDGDNDAAMIIAINSDGKILLQKEYSYPPDEILFQFPGGGAEKNEEPEVAALRELAEEANLTGTLKLLGWYYTNNRRSTQRQFVYLATNLSETWAEKDPEESFEYFWLTEQEVDQLIKSNELRNIYALSGWAIYKANK